MKNISFGSLLNANNSNILFKVVIKNSFFHVSPKEAALVYSCTQGTGVIVKEACESKLHFSRDGIFVVFNHPKDTLRGGCVVTKMFIPRRFVESVEALAPYNKCKMLGMFSLNQVTFYRM